MTKWNVKILQYKQIIWKGITDTLYNQGYLKYDYVE